MTKKKTMGKWYCLYDSKEQKKLLTTASSEVMLAEETQYFTDGVWFSYDERPNSSIIENEKLVKGTKFPAEAKVRERETPVESKPASKWIV